MLTAFTRGAQLTFDLLILLVPAAKLLAFGSGDVGIVGAIYYGRNHTLRRREGGN